MNVLSLVVGAILTLSIFAADDPGSWFLGTFVGALGSLFLVVLYGMDIDEEEKEVKKHWAAGGRANGSKYPEQKVPYKGQNIDESI